jgi:hypothetical protein
MSCLMNQPRVNKPILYALYANALGLLTIAAVMVSQDRTPGMISAAYGQQVPQPIAGGAGLFLMPAQFANNLWGCYIMDIDAQTLCAYQFVASDKTLRLIAARDFQYDRGLRNFNSPSPSPLEVAEMLKKQSDPGRALGGNAPPAPVEAPKTE